MSPPIVSHYKLRILQKTCRFRKKIREQKNEEEIREIGWNNRTKDESLESGGKRFKWYFTLGGGGKALVTRVFHAGSAFCDPFARAYTLRPFTTINHRANRSELRTTVIQPFNRFSLGWISLWASRAIRCFLTFTEKGEPKISEAIYPRNSILFVAVKGGAIIMFIGLKNIDRIAEGMFFIFIFFFLSCEYYRFPSTRGIEWKQNFLKHRNTRIVQGLTIDRAKTRRGNYAII